MGDVPQDIYMDGPESNNNMAGPSINTAAHAADAAENSVKETSKNEIMTEKGQFSEFDGFKLIETKYQNNPENKLFINPRIDLDYLKYLNKVVGPIPGTETLKVNCVASSLFSLGLAETHEYVEETQEGQTKQKLTYNKYGRTYNELCYFIARKFNIQGTYTYSFPYYSFNIDGTIEQIKEYFYTVFINDLKNGLVEGSGTIIQYGNIYKHAVSIIRDNSTKKNMGKLYLYDYQQQYFIPEEQIFDIIIKQSLPEPFEVNGQIKEGYSFIKGIDEIKNISIFIGLTHGEQLYNKASEESLAIRRRMKLYSEVTRKEAFKTFENDVKDRALYDKAAFIMSSYGDLKLEDDYRRRSLNINDLQRIISTMITKVKGNTADDTINFFLSKEIIVTDKIMQDNFDLFGIWEIIIKHYHNKEIHNTGMKTDPTIDFTAFIHYLAYILHDPSLVNVNNGDSRKNRRQRKSRKQKKSRKQRKSRKQKKSRKF